MGVVVPRFVRQPQLAWGIGWSLVLALGAVSVAARAPRVSITPLTLPGANGLVMLDYIAWDRGSHRVWVPAGNLGSVDVIDTASDAIDQVPGFGVAQVNLVGRPRVVGPSSVAVGEGVAYVGNRADSRICAIDGRTLKREECVEFAPASAGPAAAPDGLIYIKATRELWATSGAPPIGIPAADRAIRIFSTARPGGLTPAGRIPLPGSAEGYAVDDVHGRFYTNLEETGQTAEIDVRSRAIVSTWRSCGDPSGVAVDSAHALVFVACSDHVIVLDRGRGGSVVGSISTGRGVDNIDFDQEKRWLYAAAADAAKLTVTRIGDDGRPSLVARVSTPKGTRSVVAGPDGSAYLIDPYGGRVLKVTIR